MFVWAQTGGFLGTNASFMLDVVFLAMFAVVPLLGASIYLVKRRLYDWHKKLQITLAVVLLLAVAAFEVDIQFFNQWEDLAANSPYFDADRKWTCPVGLALIIHLCFAVPTFLAWVVVTVQALRHFPSPPTPGSHSRAHLRLAKPAALGMLMTAVTGWIFYIMAFAISR